MDRRLLLRGPPGTHDVGALEAVLRSFRDAKPLQLPRFDKTARGGFGARVADEHIDPVDILLIEGWFVGTEPVEGVDWWLAGPPITAQSDVDFAVASNRRLHDYLPLWRELDELIWLRAKDWRWCYEWRRRAEPNDGLSEREVDELIDRMMCSVHPAIFEKGLRQRATHILELDSERRILA